VRAAALLISDVDNTLLGDDAALETFARWRRDRGGELALVYSSGRFYDSVVESVESTQLPSPSAIIGGVGTDIRRYPSGERLDAWTDCFVGWDAVVIRNALAEFASLELQPERFLSPHKVSYYAHDAAPQLLADVQSRLAALGQQAQLVYSSQRDLDILPAAAGKGAAARFLARQWGMPAERVLVSGDSGNDASMFAQGFRGIVVANAHAELKELCNPHVYHATRAHAAGVQEGLEHWLET
jgi:sucrose-6F-phosphate phosphohydrolase